MADDLLGVKPTVNQRVLPDVFAVGDARYHSIKRVASAVGDGATAVREAHEYLASEHAHIVAHDR